MTTLNPAISTFRNNLQTRTNTLNGQPTAPSFGNATVNPQTVQPGQQATWWQTPGLQMQPGGSLYTLNPAGGGTGDSGHLYGKPGGLAPTNGTLQTFTPQLPEWATIDFQDPQAFYNTYQGFTDPGVRDSWVANMQSRYAANKRSEEAISGATAALDATRNLTSEAYSAWLNDPTFTSILDTLRRRSSGEEPLVTGVERTARMNEIAQGNARSQGIQERNAAASGGLRSAPQLHQDAATRAYYDVAGLRESANVESVNKQARDHALAATGSLLEARQGVNQRYLGAIGAVDAAKAQTLASQEFVPTDFVPFSELDFARRAYEDHVQRYDTEQARLEAEAAFSWEDGLETILRFAQAFPGGFAGIFG